VRLIAFVVLFGTVAPNVPTQTPAVVPTVEPRVFLAGHGAHPVNDEIASMWFASAPMPRSGMRPALMVYFKGPAGWHNKTTDFKSAWTSIPAFGSFKVGATQVLVQYWPEQSRALVLGSNVLVGVNNVVVATHVATPGSEPVVRAVSSYVGLVPDGENPALAVLSHSPEARRVLGLE
jgi:hypothetical protein